MKQRLCIWKIQHYFKTCILRPRLPKPRHDGQEKASIPTGFSRSSAVRNQNKTQDLPEECKLLVVGYLVRWPRKGFKSSVRSKRVQVAEWNCEDGKLKDRMMQVKQDSDQFRYCCEVVHWLLEV